MFASGLPPRCANEVALWIELDGRDSATTKIESNGNAKKLICQLKRTNVQDRRVDERLILRVHFNQEDPFIYSFVFSSAVNEKNNNAQSGSSSSQ